MVNRCLSVVLSSALIVSVNSYANDFGEQYFPPAMEQEDALFAEMKKNEYRALNKEVGNKLNISEKLAKKLDKATQKKFLTNEMTESNTYNVMITRDVRSARQLVSQISGTYQKSPDNKQVYRINGALLTKDEFKEHQKYRTKIKELKQSKLKDIHIKTLSRLATNIEKENYRSDIQIALENGSSFFEIELTQQELVDFLSLNSDDILSLGLKGEMAPSTWNDDTMFTPTGITDAINLNPNYGDSSGIYYADGMCNGSDYADGVYTVVSGIVDADYVVSNTIVNDHAMLVTGILATVSPGAKKYCYSAHPDYNYNAMLPDLNMFFNAAIQGYPINVETYSLNRRDDSTEYTVDDAIFDRHVNDFDKLVFVSAGNHDSEDNEPEMVESPAKAVNVITVGSYNDQTNEISEFSNFQNSVIGSEKPELVAPGERYYYTINGENTYFAGRNGTSFATPHTAGLMNNAIQENPFLDDTVPVGKAMALAAATDVISMVDDVDTDTIREGDEAEDSSIGAGGIDLESVTTHDRFAAYWYDSNGNGPFDANSGVISGYSCYDGWKPYLYSGEDVRVALTWTNDGDWILNTGKDQYPSEPLGTILYYFVNNPDGTRAVSSWETGNDWKKDPWVVQEFTATQTGEYTVNVCKYYEYSYDFDAELNMAIAVTAR